MCKCEKGKYNYDADCDYCRSDLEQLRAQLQLQQQKQEQLQAQLQLQQQKQEQLQAQLQLQQQKQAQLQAQLQLQQQKQKQLQAQLQLSQQKQAQLQAQLQLSHQKQEQLQHQAQLQLSQQKQEQLQLQAQLQLQQQKQEQFQALGQAQAQNDTDTSSFTNIGNPVVHVNVNEGCDKKKQDKQEKSTFRAIKNTTTAVPVINKNVKVSFTNEQFDLNNEYNSNTSTFVAKTAGVYLFTATLIFTPNNTNVDYEFGMNLRVNSTSEDVDADYTGFNAAYANAVDLSEIIKLNAGDIVEIFAFSTTPGTIVAEPRSSFAGAKIS